MNIENKHGAPESFMRFCADDDYDSGDCDFSATELLEDPKIATLKSRHPDFSINDPYDNPWVHIGQMFHKFMELNAPEEEVSEQRLFSEIDGKTISGAMDVQIIHKGRMVIGDYKVTSVFSMRDTAKWEQQLNIYAWLVEKETDSVVEKLEIYAFLRDWRISSQERMPDSYPARPGVTVDIPLWSFAKREEFIRERVRLHSTARALPDEDLPDCSRDAVWPSGTAWQLLREDLGTKKFYQTKRAATAAYDDMVPSVQLETYISKTHETLRRCKSYCEFSDTCDQWDNWRSEREASNG
tara:strand:+ start:1545 stop:2435 length:891 start_codon:yes stop_codon:yes gene_type:complete